MIRTLIGALLCGVAASGAAAVGSHGRSIAQHEDCCERADFARRPLRRLRGAGAELGRERIRSTDLDRGDSQRRAICADQRQEIEQRSTLGAGLAAAGVRFGTRRQAPDLRDRRLPAEKLRNSPPKTTEPGNSNGRPDGASLAFTSTGPESKARKDRKEKYGEIDIIGGDYTMSHLWLLKVPAEIPANVKQLPKPQALTKGEEFTVSDFAWSPDGARIAFSATRDPDLGSRDTEQLYVLDCSDLHVRQTDDVRRTQWASQMVSRRQADRVRHVGRTAIFLLREPAHRRSGGGWRLAAHSHAGLRRGRRPDRLGC